MKKIIALALALLMALSMASVAFAAVTVTGSNKPGEKMVFEETALTGFYGQNEVKRLFKVSYDFTSAVNDYKGASLIDSIVINKDGKVELTLKESLTSTEGKAIKGQITLTKKDDKNVKYVIDVTETNVANDVAYVYGAKKASAADPLNGMAKNTVMVVEEAGYVTIAPSADLTGTVKMEKNEKAQVYTITDKALMDEDTVDAIETYLGEDYDAIVEWIDFEGTGFKNDVDFRYDAYEEDPHFFYIWDGEKMVDLEAKYDADEDVDDYVFSAPAKGIIIVTDTEIVAAAEETKNPDTGANDVVGVAAALAVVSLVAAGAVSLKK